MTRQLNRNKNGFSLIELLTVVSIIGILSIIAIPQYGYYKKKARQAEAKTGLSGIYAAENSFYLEYSTYTCMLNVIGFAPLGMAYYNMGFDIISCAALPANIIMPVVNAKFSTWSMCSGPYGGGTDAGCTMIAPVPNLGLQGASALQTGFTAIALGFDRALMYGDQSPRKSILNNIIPLLVNEEAQAANPVPPTRADFYSINNNKLMTYHPVPPNILVPL